MTKQRANNKDRIAKLEKVVGDLYFVVTDQHCRIVELRKELDVVKGQGRIIRP